MPVELVAKIKNITSNDSANLNIQNNDTIQICQQDTNPMKTDMIEMFRFHSILPIDADSNQQYEHILQNKIDQTQNGKNLLFMLYGQYKSGKTYTLFGPNDITDQRGLLPNAIQHMLNIAGKMTDDKREYGVSLRVLRVFNDKLYDAMNEDSDVRIVDKKIMNGHITWAKNAAIAPIKSIDNFSTIICDISKQNQFPAFNHMIYTLFLEYQNISKNDKLRRKKHIHAQVHFVELASADKLAVYLHKKSRLLTSPQSKKKMDAHSQTNKFLHQTLESLVTIFTFIRQNAKFLPYRNSKLTHILKDCLSDPKANIIMLLTIIPTQACNEETLKTLRFGEQIYSQTLKLKSKSISKQNLNEINKTNIESMNELPNDHNDVFENAQKDDGKLTNDDMIEILYKMKQLISNPSGITTNDIENTHLRVSDMMNHLKHNENEILNNKNKMYRLETENELLKKHIENQDIVIVDFKRAIKNETKRKRSRISIKRASDPDIQPIPSFVDTKINDIEQRLKDHKKILNTLQKDCIDHIEVSWNDDISSDLSLSTVSDKRHSHELERVLASRYLFES